MRKKAIVIGLYGQDGSYLTEFLIEKRYLVYGIGNKSKKNYFKNYGRNLRILQTSILINTDRINRLQLVESENEVALEKMKGRIWKNEFFH